MRDISFARVNIDTISQTSFANSAKPSDAPEKNIGDAMVDEGVAAPKSRLSPVGMHTSTPAGDLLNIGSDYTTQVAIFLPPRSFWSFRDTIENNIGTTASQTDSLNASHQPPEVGRLRSFFCAAPLFPTWCRPSWDADFRVYDIMIRIWHLRRRPAYTNTADQLTVRLFCQDMVKICLSLSAVGVLEGVGHATSGGATKRVQMSKLVVFCEIQQEFAVLVEHVSAICTHNIVV